MFTVIDLLKGTGTVGAIALGLCLTAPSASAETKVADPKWNAATFGAACNANSTCGGGSTSNGQGYFGIITQGNTSTSVTCSATKCVYTTTNTPTGGTGGGGGSPARVATPDKTLGTGVGLGGILAGQATPQTSTKSSTGPKDPKGVNTVFAPPNPKPPKIEVAKPVRVDVPKTAAPAVKLGKDVQVNTVR